MLASIAAIVIFCLSFFGGLKDGAVKTFFSLLGLVIAIPLTGFSYHLLATVLAFLPGTNWENFFGFFITLCIISVILHFIFSLPRKLIQKVWKKGLLFRLLGGVLNLIGAGIGMSVFTLVLVAYPIIDWLERAVAGSGVLVWLVSHLGFVPAMLPEVFQNAASLLTGGPII